MNKEIIYKDLSDGPVEICRDLCDRLMAHQADKAHFHKELLAAMNFDNRLKPSFEKAGTRFLLAAFDGDLPVGYAFATAETLTEMPKEMPPSWAEIWSPDTVGFYPPWLPYPVKIGALSNLYILPEYRGLGIGEQLTDRAMAWLRSIPDTQYLAVFVSNGNNAGTFYEKYGFHHSHAVYEGLIEAYFQEV